MLNPPRRAILSRAHNTLARSMFTVRRRRIGSASLKDRLFTFQSWISVRFEFPAITFLGLGTALEHSRGRLLDARNHFAFVDSSINFLPTPPPIGTFVANKGLPLIRPNGRPSGRSP